MRFIDPSGELVELTGTEAQKEEALKRLRAMAGTQNASALGTKIVDGRTYVTYTGKGDATKTLGDFGAMIADPSKTVEFQVAKTYDRKGAEGLPVWKKGGGVTVGAEESKTGNIQIFVHPNAGGIANKIMTATYGKERSNDGRGLFMTNDVVDAHEFGHAWGQFKFGFSMKTDATNWHARQWENRQRATHPGWSNRRVRH